MCHLQFGAKIAFKAVWCPNESVDDFMLLMIDNDGALLNYGKPTDQPSFYTKLSNWRVIESSENAKFKADITAHCNAVWAM